MIEIKNLIVKKRDGRQLNYDSDKLLSSLIQANQIIQRILDKERLEKLEAIVRVIENDLYNRFLRQIKSEDIQKSVEIVLDECGELALAECYLQHQVQKEIQQKNASDINYIINQLLGKDRQLIDENANKGNVFNTQRDLTAGIAAQSTGLEMLPIHMAHAYKKGDFHYHDLDYTPYTPMTNYCFIDFKRMFE